MLAASLNKYVCDIRASWEWGIRRKRRSWCYFLNWTMFWACCFHPIWVFFFCFISSCQSKWLKWRYEDFCSPHHSGGAIFASWWKREQAQQLQWKTKKEKKIKGPLVNLKTCLFAAPLLRTVLISSLLWLLYPVHENFSIPQRLLDSKKIIPDKREEQNTRTESQWSDDWN